MDTISSLPNAVKALRRTPLRAFVLGECANSQPDDGCLFRADGCLVVQGRRCRYLEAAVLPLLTRCASARCLKLYPDAADAYRRLHRELNGVLNPEATRFCTCGKPVGKRRRLCDACATTRRREAYRRLKVRKRSLCPQLTEKSALIPSEITVFSRPVAGIQGIGHARA